MAEIFDFEKEVFINRAIAAIESQSELTEENSNIRAGLEEGIERNKMYSFIHHAKSRERAEQGLEPNPCFNSVCEHYVNSNRNPDRFNYCDEESSCHGCLLQMITPPPNSLNYSEYMPSHREALDMLEKHGLLKGDRSVWVDIFENYKKCQSQSERGNAKLDGVSIYQAEVALTKVLESLQNYFVEFENDEKAAEFIDGEKELITRNFGLELEKVLGIYPNITLVR